MKSRIRSVSGALFLTAYIGGMTTEASGQPDYGTRLGLQQAGVTRFLAQGPHVSMGALDPAVRNWYVPQELFEEHRWQQWASTNYAKRNYERYVATDIEGHYFYDLYGRLLDRGWLVYNVSQANNQGSGTSIFKDVRFQGWFNNVVVASEGKGQYRYALTASSDLRTTLTPMVLSKPRLNGVQLDLATDKYLATLIYSQLTASRGTESRFTETGETEGGERRTTNSTTLLGGRLTAQVGDFVELGVHTVHGHQSNSNVDKPLGDLLTGSLTEGQNRTVSTIEIILRDDSPEDGIGGAAYFPAGSDVIVTYRDGTVDTGDGLRFEPLIQGGRRRQGVIVADGEEEIRLTYDFEDPAFVNRAQNDKAEIVEVEFRLVLANDYEIWISSDRQTDLSGTPVFLKVTSAEGNVQDISNLRTVSFEYGLPTGTHVLGGSVRVSDVLGAHLYGEYDVSWSYRKYPNRLGETHDAASGIRGDRRAPAWMVNLSKRADPWFLFGEAYSMDPAYNTQTFVTADESGIVDYERDRYRVDFVEDNDDQDRIPDSFRADWFFPDLQVFPGWDRNLDFVPDFNQNDNRVKMNSIPDFEEPFLRFSADRPEFLFGVDMNNNFWVDLYENDDQPDYPYPIDHRGANMYIGLEAASGLRLSVGALREESISTDRHNHSTYAVVNYNGESVRYGRLRVFEMSKLVEDDIANPLLQWVPDTTIRGGRVTAVDDPLLGRDTWVNQLFLGHRFETGSLNVTNQLNWVSFRQLMSKSRRQRLSLDGTDFFFGAINKASYQYRLARLTLEPRWKSEFRKQTRGLFDAQEHTSLMELVSGLVTVPVLRASQLQAGVEYVYFNDVDRDAEDFDSISYALQFSTSSEYLGYRIQALAGAVIERKDFEGQEATTTTQSFITVYAGLGKPVSAPGASF